VSRKGRIVHIGLAVVIAAAVPTVAALVNGALVLEFIVLGAVIGFAYWYWRPQWPPL
jgi:hypothetical protein